MLICKRWKNTKVERGTLQESTALQDRKLDCHLRIVSKGSRYGDGGSVRYLPEKSRMIQRLTWMTPIHELQLPCEKCPGRQKTVQAPGRSPEHDAQLTRFANSTLKIK